MLPSEKSSDPLFLSRFKFSTSHGSRPSGQVAFEQEFASPDLLLSDNNNNHLSHPTFSIRDYVHTTRDKNIETNWPFSQQCLQQCLNNGVKDLLPPFEPPDSVRNHCSCLAAFSYLNARETTKEVGLLEVENIHQSPYSSKEICKPLVKSNHQAQSPLQEQDRLSFSVDASLHASGIEGKFQSPKVVNNAQHERESVPCDEGATSNLLRDSIEIDNLQPPCPSQKNETIVEPSGKRSRLVLKLGPILDPSRTEDTSSNIAATSDPMASKICPVCKSFSSTSNTTLNAHIDQCLAGESTSKCITVSTNLIKHRVKPRKKRLMVDIYETAPSCTLEELDRRNGSNWATDLSLPNAESEVTGHGKRQRMTPVGMDDNDDDSAVYFDSNGTKLRILSKFSNPSPSTVGEHSGVRINSKNEKENKIVSLDKKKRFAEKHSKYLKGKPRNKKLCSLDAVEVRGAPDMIGGMDTNCEKEESLSLLLRKHDEINRNESGTLRSWVSSKRTGLLKRVNGNDGRRILKFPSFMKMNLLHQNGKPSLDNSGTERNCVMKASNPNENVGSSSKSKPVGRQPYEVKTNGGGRKSHKEAENELHQLNGESAFFASGGCMLKFPRSPGRIASSPRCKRIEVHATAYEVSDKSLKKTVNTLESRKRNFIKGKKFTSFSNFMSKESEKRPSSKVSPIRKSIAEVTAQIGAQSLNAETQQDWMHDCTENVPGSLNRIGGNNHSDSSSDGLISETEEVMDRVSLGRSKVLKPRRGNQTCNISEREEAVGLTTSSSGIEFHDRHHAAYADSQVKAPLQRSQCGYNFTDQIGGIEAGIEEDPLHVKIAIKSIFNKDAGRSSLKTSETSASEVNSRVGELSSSKGQYTKCGTHPASFPPPPALILPSGSNDLQENSSITSSKFPSSQGRHLMLDRDSSESPVSATSIISNPTMAILDLKYPEPVSSLKTQVKFISGTSGERMEPRGANATTPPFMLTATGVESIDLDWERLRGTTGPREVSMKFPNDQPCCCSRKESFSMGSSLGYRDSPRSEQHTSMMAMPVKGKQMSHPNIGPDMFMSYSVSRNGEAANSVFESPSGRVSRKEFSDSVKNHGDFGLAQPPSQAHDVQSSSNSVFRLMGKNLMVPVQLRQPEVSPVFPSTGYSNGSNQESFAFYNTAREGFPVFNRDSYGPPQTQPNQLSGNHHNIDMGGFVGSSLPRGSNGITEWPTPQRRPNGRPGCSFSYDVERVDPNQEVIIIEDSPDNEAEPSTANAKYIERFNWSQPSPVGVLPPSTFGSNLQQMNAIPCHTSSNSFSQVELGSYHGGRNISPLKWGVTPEGGSSFSLRGPFMPKGSPCRVSQGMYDLPNMP